MIMSSRAAKTSDWTTGQAIGVGAKDLHWSHASGVGAGVLDLQRLAGNRAVGQLLARNTGRPLDPATRCEME
jgi:hypothetical protein